MHIFGTIYYVWVIFCYKGTCQVWACRERDCRTSWLWGSLLLRLGCLLLFHQPSLALCAQSEEELPERLAGTVRFSHLRLKDAAYLDEESGKIYKGGQPV